VDLQSNNNKNGETEVSQKRKNKNKQRLGKSAEENSYFKVVYFRLQVSEKIISVRIFQLFLFINLTHYYK